MNFACLRSGSNTMKGLCLLALMPFMTSPPLEASDVTDETTRTRRMNALLDMYDGTSFIRQVFLQKGALLSLPPTEENISTVKHLIALCLTDSKKPSLSSSSTRQALQDLSVLSTSLFSHVRTYHTYCRDREELLFLLRKLYAYNEKRPLPVLPAAILSCCRSGYDLGALFESLEKHTPQTEKRLLTQLPGHITCAIKETDTLIAIFNTLAAIPDEFIQTHSLALLTPDVVRQCQKDTLICALLYNLSSISDLKVRRVVIQHALDNKLISTWTCSLDVHSYCKSLLTHTASPL
jgi:hypothetical protein